MRVINLHTADPGNDCSHAGGYEAYAAVPMDAVRWEDGRNVDEIVFPEATGGKVTFTHASASEGGCVLRSDRLTVPITVEHGTTPRFPVGAFTFTED